MYQKKIEKYRNVLNDETLLEKQFIKLNSKVDDKKKIKSIKKYKILIEKEKIVPDAINEMLNFEQIEEALEKRQLIYIEKQDSE